MTTKRDHDRNDRSRMRMDEYKSQYNERGRAGPRREIDNVIKKARRESSQSGYWNKRVLEVEEKEPDRWRHSGYKELYVEEKRRSQTPVADEPNVKYSPPGPSGMISRPTASSSRKSLSPRNRIRNVNRPGNNHRSPIVRAPKSPPVRRSRTPIMQNKPPIQPNRYNRSPIQKRIRSPPRNKIRPMEKFAPKRQSPIRQRSPMKKIRSPVMQDRSRGQRSPIIRARSPVRVRSPVRMKSPPRERSPLRRRSPIRLRSPLVRKRTPIMSLSPVDRRRVQRSPLPVIRRSRTPNRKSSPPQAYAKNAINRFTTKRKMPSARPSPIVKKTNVPVITLSSEKEVLSSSECSDSNCSMCTLQMDGKTKSKIKGKHHIKSKVTNQPPMIPNRARTPTLPVSRHARSKSLSSTSTYIGEVSSPLVRKVKAATSTERLIKEAVRSKRRKKSPTHNPSSDIEVVDYSSSVDKSHRKKVKSVKKKKSKKKSKRSDKTSQIISKSLIHKHIKTEPTTSSSEEGEDGSESSSPKRLTLSERFGKMAQWNASKELESRHNIRIVAGGSSRHDKLEPVLIPPDPYVDGPGQSLLLEDAAWEETKSRYIFYKDQGLLQDLTFQEYVKWEEWWYKYQEWLETEKYFERFGTYRRHLI